MKTEQLQCFVSYSHKDKKMCDEFLEHIKCLERIYDIKHWYDGMIPPGGNIDDEIKNQLDCSDVVFLLVSSSYINSYYCYEKELKDALMRQDKGMCKVIPVIIKKYASGQYLFSHLRFVPTDGRPVTTFKSHNDGFVDAVTGIMRLLEDAEKPHNESYKKLKSKSTQTSKGKRKVNASSKDKLEIRYKIIKNEKISNVKLTKDVFESIVTYGNNLPKFVNDMDVLSRESYERFKKDSQKPLATRNSRYSINAEDFMIQMCGYIQRLFVGYDNTCIHIRKRENDFYCDYVELGYSKNDLSTGPIIAKHGMIECSINNNMPVIKSLNGLLHKKSHPDEKIRRNYITFAFNGISKLFGVDLSMCVSVVGANISNEMFVAMSIMRFDLLIEKYLIQYIEHCKKIDAKYDVDSILKLEV